MTPFSKTDVPCDCNYLQRAADEPSQPIEFDPRLNEFNIVYTNPHGGEGRMRIYHCPLCGGTTPVSKRSSLFSRPSDEERLRLTELTKHLKTLEDLLLALGPPDWEREAGEAIVTPEQDGQPETTVYYRTLAYKNLSETADVRVRVYPTNQVAVSFIGKQLREKADQSTA